MAAEFTSANCGGDSPVRPQELEKMINLVVDAGDGKTIEIPLKGHLTLNNRGSPSGAAAGEAKNYNDMRGWIMTVATLFVGMSFQAMSQRPSWMTDPKGGIKFFDKNGINRTDHASKRTDLYVILNTITFSMSLVVVVVLILPNILPAQHTMTAVTAMMTVLAITVALNYSFMISMDDRIMYTVLGIIVTYSTMTILMLAFSKKLLTLSGYAVNRLRRHRSAPDVHV